MSTSCCIRRLPRSRRQRGCPPGRECTPGSTTAPSTSTIERWRHIRAVVATGSSNAPVSRGVTARQVERDPTRRQRRPDRDTRDSEYATPQTPIQDVKADLRPRRAGLFSAPGRPASLFGLDQLPATRRPAPRCLLTGSRLWTRQACPSTDRRVAARLGGGGYLSASSPADHPGHFERSSGRHRRPYAVALIGPLLVRRRFHMARTRPNSGWSHRLQPRFHFRHETDHRLLVVRGWEAEHDVAVTGGDERRRTKRRCAQASRSAALKPAGSTRPRRHRCACKCPPARCTASSFESRISTGPVFNVRSISRWSRPTSSQCRRSAASLRAKFSGPTRTRCCSRPRNARRAAK